MATLAANTTTDWLNVVSYGADPSGAQDSTAAITAALQAAPAGRRCTSPPEATPFPRQRESWSGRWPAAPGLPAKFSLAANSVSGALPLWAGTG